MATFHGKGSEGSARYLRQWQEQEAQRMEMERQVRLRNAPVSLIIDGEYVDVTGQKRLSSKGNKE
jgi:hypothetical protein